MSQRQDYEYVFLTSAGNESVMNLVKKTLYCIVQLLVGIGVFSVTIVQMKAIRTYKNCCLLQFFSIKERESLLL